MKEKIKMINVYKQLVEKIFGGFFGNSSGATWSEYGQLLLYTAGIIFAVVAIIALLGSFGVIPVLSYKKIFSVLIKEKNKLINEYDKAEEAEVTKIMKGIECCNRNRLRTSLEIENNRQEFKKHQNELREKISILKKKIFKRQIIYYSLLLVVYSPFSCSLLFIALDIIKKI